MYRNFHCFILSKTHELYQTEKLKKKSTAKYSQMCHLVSHVSNWNKLVGPSRQVGLAFRGGGIQCTYRGNGTPSAFPPQRIPRPARSTVPSLSPPDLLRRWPHTNTFIRQFSLLHAMCLMHTLQIHSYFYKTISFEYSNVSFEPFISRVDNYFFKHISFYNIYFYYRYQNKQLVFDIRFV